MSQLGKQTTANVLDLEELERRVDALEREYAGMRADLIKYVDHCIVLMKVLTKLGTEMQQHGMDTDEASRMLRDAARPKH